MILPTKDTPPIWIVCRTVISDVTPEQVLADIQQKTSTHVDMLNNLISFNGSGAYADAYILDSTIHPSYFTSGHFYNARPQKSWHWYTFTLFVTEENKEKIYQNWSFVPGDTGVFRIDSKLSPMEQLNPTGSGQVIIKRSDASSSMDSLCISGGTHDQTEGKTLFMGKEVAGIFDTYQIKLQR